MMLLGYQQILPNHRWRYRQSCNNRTCWSMTEGKNGLCWGGGFYQKWYMVSRPVRSMNHTDCQ
jgi:hypothetical protein